MSMPPPIYSFKYASDWQELGKPLPIGEGRREGQVGLIARFDAIQNYVIRILRDQPNKPFYIFEHDPSFSVRWEELKNALIPLGFNSAGAHDRHGIPPVVGRGNDYADPALWYADQKQFYVWKEVREN